MITVYDSIVQGTDEWFEMRKRKMTASNATTIRANGKGLDTYCRKIVSEVYGQKEETYTNKDIDRGKELEPIGRSIYEMETGNDVYEVGCIENDDYQDALASPDGLVGADGGIEIKARNNEKHFALICGDEKDVPVDQIQFTLMITGRKWWDFVSVNTNFEKSVFIKRIYPDKEMFNKFKAGLSRGRELINKYSEIYTNSLKQ